MPAGLIFGSGKPRVLEYANGIKYVVTIVFSCVFTLPILFYVVVEGKDR